MNVFRNACILLTATFLFAASSAGADNLKQVTLAQSIPHIDIRNAPWAVAEEMGWLAQEGLEVNIQTVAGGTVAVQQVLNGNAEYAMPPIENAVHAFLRGGPVKFFYSFTTRSPFPIIALADGPIKSLEDFKGTNIGVHSLTGVQFYTIQAILNSVDYQINRDFNLVAVGPGAASLRALERGMIAGLSTSVIAYAGFENRGSKFNYFITPEVERSLGWSLMSTDAYLEENRAEAEGLARAFTKGHMFCRENATECVEAYFRKWPQAKPTGFSDEEAVTEALYVLDVFLDYAPQVAGNPWGYFDPEAWEVVADYMHATGQVDEPFDPAPLFTNELVTNINDFDHAEVMEKAKVE